MTERVRGIPKKAAQRAKNIRFLLMDVDGVLTDGHVRLQSFPDSSVAEMKVFHAHDGAGLKLAHVVGLRTGLITGRDSPAVARRARECAIEFVVQGQAEKLPAYKVLVERVGVSESEVAYIGDDLPDLPVMNRVGLAIAVANAAPEVKKAAHYITARSGGEGAVREVVELILKAQRKWPEAIGKARA